MLATRIDQSDFSAACWYHTGLLRLMLRDLSQFVVPNSDRKITREHSQLIRRAEYPLRRLLKFDWERFSPGIEFLAKRNRACLMVFDRTLATETDLGLSSQFLPMLNRILRTWHELLYEDTPNLLNECRSRSDRRNNDTVAFSKVFDELPGSLPDDLLENEFRETLITSDPVSILLQSWLFAFEAPELWSVIKVEAADKLASLAPEQTFTRVMRGHSDVLSQEILELAEQQRY